jgi:hypothetical protein
MTFYRDPDTHKLFTEDEGSLRERPAAPDR